MALDWSKPVCTKHERPLIGFIMPDIGPGPKKRVAMPSLSKGREAHEHLTVYRFGEDGISRCDGAPSDYDLVNFDPSDGRDRASLHPAAMRGAA